MTADLGKNAGTVPKAQYPGHQYKETAAERSLDVWITRLTASLTSPGSTKTLAL